MKNVLRSVLTAIASLTILNASVYADESIDMSDFADDFSHETVLEEEAASQPAINTQNLELVLINNNRNYVLITAVLYAFVLMIIAFLTYTAPNRQPKDLITVIGLVSVIFGSILLVLVVDTTETLTAPMGILGAIAGYLFGSAQKKEA